MNKRLPTYIKIIPIYKPRKYYCAWLLAWCLFFCCTSSCQYREPNGYLPLWDLHIKLRNHNFIFSICLVLKEGKYLSIVFIIILYFENWNMCVACWFFPSVSFISTHLEVIRVIQFNENMIIFVWCCFYKTSNLT